MTRVDGKRITGFPWLKKQNGVTFVKKVCQNSILVIDD